MIPIDALQQLGYDETSEFWITKDKANEFNSSLWRVFDSETKDAQGIEVCGSYVFRTSAKDENGKALLAPRPAVHVVKAQNQDQATLIRKKLWNLGSAPFIIIILPERILVYSGFDYDDKKQSGDALYRPALSSSEISKHLKNFYASEIDSGAIWINESKKLNPEKRVDQRLLVELKNLGKVLTGQHNVKPEIAHALIGKFIYIWYLRERGILTDSWLKAEQLASWKSITERNTSAADLKSLVEALEKCFNGKIFPLNFDDIGGNADEIVQLVAGVFRGDDSISRQLALNFKIYDFSCIPVELLSSIYEQFLHAEGKGKDEGAVYTREFVADYLLAEINSVKPLQEGMKILDPACGSGVFLVLSYRRLIEIRLRKEGKEKLSPHELGAILEQSIFGVELIRDACYVTEFSLILMLLSYVDPPDLEKNKDFHFPELHNTNIIEGDFFNDELPIFKQEMKFDWIVGNPSWQKLESGSAAKKQPYAWDWMQNDGNKDSRPVGDFSLSEAFSWRSVDLLNEDGYVGLLVHAMSLFNGTSKNYRSAFFKAHEVRRITNFANLTYVLFVGRAKVPGATVIFKKAKQGAEKPAITHYAPFKVNQIFGRQERRSNNTAWSLTIYEDEIQTVEANDAESGEASVWKFAMWGSYRDKRLVARLESHFSQSLKQHNYLPRQGLDLLDGNTLSEIRKEELKCLELDDLPRLDVKVIQGEFFLTAPLFANSIVDESNRFIRKRSGRAGLTVAKAPHVYWSLSGACYSDTDFFLPNPQMAFAAPQSEANHLRAISAYLNSSVGRYLTFFHCIRWGIERTDFGPAEARTVPIPNFTPEQIAQLAEFHRRLSGQQIAELASKQIPLFEGQSERMRPAPATPDQEREIRRQLDDEVERVLGIPPHLAIVPREFMDVRFQFTHGKSNVPAAMRVKDDALARYAQCLARQLDDFARTSHRVSISQDRDFIVCTIEITDEKEPIEPTVFKGEPNKEDRQLWQDLRQPFSQWVYVQRSLRVFEGRKIHLWKNARVMDWTQTQAILDADSIISDVLTYTGETS